MSQPASIQPQSSRALPDYLPARMINEFVYCPRLFYYEQVQGVFVESADTIEGSIEHRRVDKESGEAPPPTSVSEEPVIARSITLSSEQHKVIAKLDLAEFADGKAVPVDYKHGRPIAAEDGYQPWPSERVQLAIQAIVLRANGYRCDEGIIYYTKSRQRVRVVFDEAVIAEAQRAIEEAWQAARLEQPPPPLVDSPKCPGCSLVGICLPDETWSLQAPLQDTMAPRPNLQLELFEVLPSGSPVERNPDARLLVTSLACGPTVRLPNRGFPYPTSAVTFQPLHSCMKPETGKPLHFFFRASLPIPLSLACRVVLPRCRQTLARFGRPRSAKVIS